MNDCILCKEDFVIGDQAQLIGNGYDQDKPPLVWVHVKCLIADVLPNETAWMAKMLRAKRLREAANLLEQVEHG